MADSKNYSSPPSFVDKVWIVGAIFALILTLFFVFRATFNIFILILAGALMACYFRGISAFLRRKIGWNSKLTLSISVFGTLLILVGIFYLTGATIANQASDIQNSFPDLIGKVKETLESSSVGKQILVQIQSVDLSDKIGAFLSTFFQSTFGGIGDLYVILLVGVFFTVSPSLYTKGVIALVPPKGRSIARELMNELGTGLTNWLLGKFIAMFAVFVLTAIGLIILGIPMWLTLAILAGLLNFIPNFGPITAMIPGVLVALSDSPTKALLVLGMYLLVQLIENSLITPKAQEKLIKMAPALIILAQVFLGALTGIWGVIFATPFLLIIILIVKKLYIKPMEEKS